MPAVLVHGVPDTPRLWDALRGKLDRTDILTPNLPGFGAPVPAGFGATKEEYVEWLTAEIEAVGEPVDLVGHDWGSLLVQRVVSVRPDLIRTWAAGAATADREYAWHDMAVMWQTPDVGEQIMAAMTGDALADALAPEVGRERAVGVAEHVDDTMKDCILRLYRSAVDVGAQWHDGVDAIDRPGLVIWGGTDPFVTRDFGERLARRTGAELLMLDDCGHWWPVREPAAVAAALAEHWR